MKRKETIHRRRIEIGCLRTSIHVCYFSNLPVTKITFECFCVFKRCFNQSISYIQPERKEQYYKEKKKIKMLAIIRKANTCRSIQKKCQKKKDWNRFFTYCFSWW